MPSATPRNKKKEEEHLRTLEEIEACEKTMLTPQDVSDYLGCHHYSINVAARDCPDALGFPVIKMGSRVRIPKEGFVRFCRGLEAKS